MAAHIFPGTSIRDSDGLNSELSMHMDDNGYYWHLYPYFESAKLPGAQELVDLYGDNEIDGYELDRLRSKMLVAKNDLGWRSDSWEVVTGWNRSQIDEEHEIRRRVEKTKMAEMLDGLIRLIDHCKANGLKVCVFGD